MQNKVPHGVIGESMHFNCCLQFEIILASLKSLILAIDDRFGTTPKIGCLLIMRTTTAGRNRE